MYRCVHIRRCGPSVERSAGRRVWLTLDRSGVAGGIGSAFGPSLMEELTHHLDLAPGSASCCRPAARPRPLDGRASYACVWRTRWTFELAG